MAAQWTPVGLRGAQTTVVVQLAGDPVAVVEADAGPRSSSKAEKQAIKAELKATQDGLRGEIAKLGGTVLADYQVAYNGIKVRIDREQARRARRRCPGVTARAGAPADEARQRPRRAAHRRARRVGRPGRPPRRGHQGRRHRHRHRLHARQLRRPGHGRRRTTRPTRPTRCPPTPRCSVLRRPASRAASTSSATTTTPTPDAATQRRSRIRIRTRSTATATARTSPARPPARACSRTAPPTPARTTRPRSARNSWTIGPGVAPKADLYGVRVFGCLGSTERDRRRDRVGRRQRHGRDQHVARLAVRLQGRSVGRRFDERGEGRRDRRHLGGQQRPEPVHHRLAGHRRRARSRRPRAIRRRRSRASNITAGDADDPGDQRQRASESDRSAAR